ncbi:MAG: serine/threonine-protein kinase [bacterium]
MSLDRDAIDAFLKSVYDGTPVDWEAAVRDSDPVERPRVEGLRDVARVAAFHRTQMRESRVGSTVADRADGPERWGDLMLLERIGSGARGDVYRAWDPKLLREVALKLIREEGGAAQGAEESPLLREGRAAARVRHPHVVAVHGIDSRDGRVGLWMELVRGTTLEQEVQSRRGALDPAEVTRVGLEIASALGAVHAAGILHRDVKPANVVRDEEGRYVLADFGLGARWDDESLRGARPSGTPMYMAPELLAGGAPSVRTDLYALGLLLWFALAGRQPFEVDSLGELRRVAAGGPTPSLKTLRRDADPRLVAVIERAISPAPEARFASATEMVEALRAVGASGRGRVSGSRRMLAVAGVAAVAVAAVFAIWRDRAGSPATRPASASAPAVAASAPAAPASDLYSVDASLLLRGNGSATRLLSGDRVGPGDRLSLELKTTRRAWAYVLNQDERGESYLLFPQPAFDLKNPLPADTTWTLPGPISGHENAWTVTSRGGREHFLIVVSPEPVPELEADLGKIPAPTPGRAVQYASVSSQSVERLRGAGGLAELPAAAPAGPAHWQAFDRFRGLAGREDGVRGIWVRHVVLENPAR